MPHRTALLALVTLVAAGSERAARATEAAPPPAAEPELTWNPAWPKVRWPELTVTGASLAIAIAAAATEPLPSHRRGPILFDDAVHSALRLPSARARLRARRASDALAGITLLYPTLIDVLAVTVEARQSPAVAAQMVMINAEVLAVTAAVQGLTNVLVSRERPYGRECGASLDASSDDCTRAGRYRSFFSGHTSMAFAAAASTCAHHRYLRLHGDRGVDAVPCVAGFLLAGTTGALRLAADRHYVSDVLIGATVGTLIGYGIPYLFHYRHGAAIRPSASGRGFSLALVPASVGTGAGVAGAF
jgi:membrane-associated phospholipid phosphatase